MTKKVLLVNLPKYDTIAPPGALAILAAVAEQNNYDYEFLDFNIILHHYLTEEEKNELDDWMIGVVVNFDDLSSSLRDKVFNEWKRQVNLRNINQYDFVAISIFSIWSLRMAQLVLPWLRKNTTAKIVLGGNGVNRLFTDSKKPFHDWLDENNLADFVVYGDGEPTFDAILKHETNIAGVNRVPQINDHDINTFPIPEYSKFDYSLYGKKKIYVTGSRGCVRKCTFCDVATMWPKFRYRKAEHLLEEIRKNYYELGVTNFDFTDSLINGSISNFYRFNCLLAEEKQKNPDLKDVKFMGQFICRPKTDMPESHYEAMYYAGCEQVTIGIESFSEDVRMHMKKKFSNADIDYHIEQSSYWNIRNVWLMICGYPTETLEDHHRNLDGLRRYQKYSKQGVLELIHWGHTMHLIDDTPIAEQRMLDELEIIVHSAQGGFTGFEDTYNWVSGKNPDLTLLERIRRRVELHELSISLGYLQPRVRQNLNTLLSLSKQANPENYTKKIFDIKAA